MAQGELYYGLSDKDEKEDKDSFKCTAAQSSAQTDRAKNEGLHGNTFSPFLSLVFQLSVKPHPSPLKFTPLALTCDQASSLSRGGKKGRLNAGYARLFFPLPSYTEPGRLLLADYLKNFNFAIPFHG